MSYKDIVTLRHSYITVMSQLCHGYITVMSQLCHGFVTVSHDYASVIYIK
jgi:hypothetical protein